MNLPGVKVDLPVITEKDERDLLEFACRQPIDFIAASFVTKASDIKLIRKTLGPRARSIKIIAKIENQEGLENYDEILAETDGIMVARGGAFWTCCVSCIFLSSSSPTKTLTNTCIIHTHELLRPGHGNRTRKSFPGSEDDDPQGKCDGEARNHSHANAGVNDQQPPPHARGVH